MLAGPYRRLYEELSRAIPAKRLIHDPLLLFAHATDASFYRLIPKLAVKVENEEEVAALFRSAARFETPLTFRAAGTSLSGQSVSDSVLVLLGGGWERMRILEDGMKIALEPGVIGGHANLALSPYLRKIGPDPASIHSAMIGGIAANNASGMCCGISQNSYQTLVSMKIIFPDGSRLDTADPESCRQWTESHTLTLGRLGALVKHVRNDPALSARIRRKYKMKNTTGYSLNALVDFEEPLDVIQHLMIGSEGTLGFIAEVTLRTVPEFPCRASVLIFFQDIETACRAVSAVSACRVSAVELMDRASLRAVENKPGMPDFLKTLASGVAALLIECRAPDPVDLEEQTRSVTDALKWLPKIRPAQFTREPAEYSALWNIRKGLFPSVGAIRQTGTTVIIEDVAFPLPGLAAAVRDLQALFARHGYSEAILFGHALSGNLHFVFTQDFNTDREVSRYEAFMRELAELVVGRYDGSLKAEHGTGRNMASFVEKEWGGEAYGLMKEIKEIFDPRNLLNPGVILNADPRCHVKNLKPLPSAHPLIDKCTECGFCEPRCPSKGLTLTPRQRISVYREIVSLEHSGRDQGRLGDLKRAFQYQGIETCATDGLCALNCPVGIDTGRLMKTLRARNQSAWSRWAASWVSRHLSFATFAARQILNGLQAVRRMTGSRMLSALSGAARNLSGKRLPLWNPSLPAGAKRIVPPFVPPGNALRAVYFPSCVTRVFGPVKGHDREQAAVMESLLRKAGYSVLYPRGFNGLCCGLAFESKGFEGPAEAKRQELLKALRSASEEGKYPVVFDTSPCLQRMKEVPCPGVELYDTAEFVLRFLKERLAFSPLEQTVALHTACSVRKMGSEDRLEDLAALCAKNYVFTAEGCCGFAGDKGLMTPELAVSAARKLLLPLPAGCKKGFSTSRTCEIGLSWRSGIEFRSIASLVEQATAGIAQPEPAVLAQV